MNETPRTKRGWRILRRILISLAVLATLIAHFLHRGRLARQTRLGKLQTRMEAKGEKLDWQAFVPPSVPDDQNFFTAPIFTNMLNGKIVMKPYGNPMAVRIFARKR